MVWLTWNHPGMPWVATEAWVGEILPDGTVGNAHQVAGGPDESVFQPEWSPDGSLFFISDRGGGWWNLYRYRDGDTEPMAPMDAEFGRPQWKFGMSTYAFESDERLICCFVRDGVQEAIHPTSVDRLEGQHLEIVVVLLGSSITAVNVAARAAASARLALSVSPPSIRPKNRGELPPRNA